MAVRRQARVPHCVDGPLILRPDDLDPRSYVTAKPGCDEAPESIDRGLRLFDTLRIGSSVTRQMPSTSKRSNIITFAHAFAKS